MDDRAEDSMGDINVPTQAVVTEDSASQFRLLEEEMVTARENLRSPQLSYDEAKRSQGPSLTDGRSASFHQDDQSLRIEPSREISGNVSFADQPDLHPLWARKSSANRKRMEVSGEGVEDEVSKRACVERDCDFISERVLELAQVFAPPQFEFPMQLVPPSSTIAFAPPTENPNVVEIMSASEEENAVEENFVPVQSPAQNTESPPHEDIAEKMEVDPSLEPEVDTERAEEDPAATPSVPSPHKDLAKSSAQEVTLHPPSSIRVRQNRDPEFSESD